MADKKISQLDSASSVSSGAYFPISQSGTTYKGTTDQIGEQIAKNQDFSELNTTSKKIIGAINEVLTTSNIDILNTIDTPAAIMTFNDGGDNIPVNKLLVAVTAQQAGTGTPALDNVRAITGWSQAQITRCGKNFYPVKVGRDLFADNRGSTHTTNDDILTITMASENNSGVYGGTGVATNNTICQTIKKFSGSFVFSLYAKASANNSDVYFGFGSFGNTVVTLSTSWQRVELPLTLDSAIHTLNFYNRSGSAITVDVKDVQIEQALSTATPYEAYKGITVVIPFGDTYYGGVLDVTNGKLTVTYKIWQASSATAYGNVGTSHYAYDANNKPDGMTQQDFLEVICDKYQCATTSEERLNGYCYTTSSGNIVFIDDRFTSLANAQSVLSSEAPQIVYPLATPVVINLTPEQITTLSGLNNIYADCGDIQELEYFNENADDLAKLIRAMA